MNIFQFIRLNEIDNYENNINNIFIDIINEYGQNLLHEAIAYSRTYIGFDLIQRRININHQDKKGQTPLHYTALHNNDELAKKIIMVGGDVNICDLYGNNALWTATFNARGNYEIVKLYIQAGGDPNSKNNNNKSPLDFAKQIKDEILINILNY